MGSTPTPMYIRPHNAPLPPSARPSHVSKLEDSSENNSSNFVFLEFVLLSGHSCKEKNKE